MCGVVLQFEGYTEHVVSNIHVFLNLSCYKSTVMRENLLVSSKAHRWRRKFDELQGNFIITTRQEAMTATQASAISGATTGFLLGCALCKFEVMNCKYHVEVSDF